MKQVLIAEDDRILRKRIMRAIKDRIDEAAFHEADNGEEAMLLLKKETMDVVITDIQMPKVNGLMLLAFLNAFAPEIPCFVITAYGTARLKSKMPPDLLRFYDKPIDVDELAVSVVAALNRRRDPNICGGILLPDFLRLVAADQATATITATQEGHPSCKFFFKEGELIDAAIGDKRGEPAAILGMSWPAPNYAIEFGIPDGITKTIKTPLTQLLRVVSECFDEE